MPGVAMTLEGAGRPGLAAVDELARRMLEAARTGSRLAIEYLDPDLSDLLELAGLSAKVHGQAEGGEQAPRVEGLEEEGELGDPSP